MIFLSGVHGVGKSYFCKQLKEEIGIQTYTSSELISAEKEEIFSSEKLSKDIEDNQHYLLQAVHRLNSGGSKYILDGHFCLLNGTGQITRISIDTFIGLNPSLIILLTEEPKIIAERRKYRDGVECDIELISCFQKEEISYAEEIAKLLSVELIISKGKDDLNSIINYIDNI